jgi:hypothetical protein
MVRDVTKARKRVYGSGYENVANLPEEIVRAWLEAAFATPESGRQFQRLITSLRARDLLAVEPALEDC